MEAEKEKRDLEILRRNGLDLKYIEDQTPEICMAAVWEDPDVIQYIRNPEIKKQVEKFLKQRQVSEMLVF